MTANTEAIYAQTPFHATATVAAQTAPRVITTQTPVLLKTVGTDGGFIHNLTCTPLGDNVASVLFVYCKLENETGYHLILEVNLPLLSATTVAAAIAPIVATLPIVKTGASDRYVLDIPANASIYVALGTAVANGYQVNAYGGEY